MTSEQKAKAWERAAYLLECEMRYRETEFGGISPEERYIRDELCPMFRNRAEFVRDSAKARGRNR